MTTLCLCMAFSYFSFTQQSSDIQEIDQKTWSVSMQIGGNIVGGQNARLEEEMTKQGFCQTSTPVWFSNTGRDYPYSKSYPSITLNAKYYLTDPISIGFIAGFSHLGEVHGNKNNNRLSLTSTLFSFSPIMAINEYDILKIGIGPALYFTSTYTGSLFDTEGTKYNKAKLGFLIDLGLRVPKSRRFFIEVDLQIRIVGNSEVGPFKTNTYDPEIFQKISINYSHAFLGVGMGFRF